MKPRPESFRHAVVLFAAVAASGVAGAGTEAAAQMSWTEKVSVEGPGAAAGGGSLEIRVRLDGPRRRSDVSGGFRADDPVLTALGITSASEIVRLDTGEILRVDPAKRTVIEETLRERRSRVRRIQKSRDASDGVKDISVELQPTGAARAVFGIEAEQMMVRATATLVGEDGEEVPVIVQADAWLAPSFEGRSQIEEFLAKLGEGIGEDPELLRLQALVDPRYGPVLSEIHDALGAVRGHPLSLSLSAAPAAAQQAPDRARGSRAAAGARPTPEEGELREGTIPYRRGDAGRRGGRRSRPPEMVRDAPATAAPRRRTLRALRDPVWTLVREVRELRVEEEINEGLFESPEGFRTLVPRSRRRSRAEREEASGKTDGAKKPPVVPSGGDEPR